jgi:prepilin-type N-terminal cleavage/methylation domain-containing protein
MAQGKMTTVDRRRAFMRCPRTLVRRLRQTCAATAGMSLVEVLVAAAIVAIVSVMIVFAFYTMANVSKRASDITDADEQLSEDIALDDAATKSSAKGTVTLTPGTGGSGITLDSTFNTWETEDGRSFLTFEYKPSGTTP